jgi:uncharacterized protein involved in type VI secretion and phage assembly
MTGKADGVVIGVVSDRDDKEGLGRVKLTLPAFGNRETDWARVAVPYGGAAGKGHGVFWIPEKGDEVLVAFVQGDGKVPIVIGSLHSTRQKPPTQTPDERVFKSRNGHTIIISDESGRERIEIRTSSGQKVTLDENSGAVTVKATSKVVVDAPAVSLGGDPAVHPAILGDLFMTAFAAHTHPLLPPTGMTGPVTPPIPPNTVLSTMIKLKG